MKKNAFLSPESQILWFLKKLSVSGKGVLLGFSGGVDSTVLLHLLHQQIKALDFRLWVLHVDHGLRGKESRQDAIHCRAVCESLDLPFLLVKKNISLLAKKTKSSLELAARDFRKRIFLETALRLRCDFIFLGHTQDDQVETLLFRLFRGTGLHGISGMQESTCQRGLTWCRPLLPCSKEALLALALEKKWPWVEDGTNRSLEHTRNRIRLELIPVLKKIFPYSFPEALLRFGELCRLGREEWMAQISPSFVSAFSREGESLRIDLEKLKGVSKLSFVELLREHASFFHSEGYLPSFERCEALFELCSRETGKKIELWPGVWALKKRGVVVLEVGK